ncbi:bifunctional folylpolyglutamate synthase/dihydrofolate synthase [Psychrobacter sp. I-STPA6b]|uniref:bifunctional folylpolyglutamate synthase/dihydrofolate synthase n=1 Tax=Psychrobacter sp. I-STPA6b TaxID=2585718 RepID=UPI001D0C2D19|nr:folylpolyglutamate synthase/dihydrofolate synthase family protein [Psychrobacter sp. I-STPA6b]
MSINPPMQPTTASSLSDWLVYMQQIHVSAIDMGLSRVLPVAEYLGVVQSAKDDAYVFMVAGTNGKGSTTATIAQICQQAGYKTALYQSPHLIDFNERVRINGQAVGDEKLIQAFAKVEQARIACELTLSFFEMTTLAAMLIFAEADCDVWVLEVGLGGRLDVVNIIDADMAVITNIGIDHVDWLGNTLEQIGYEKAGVLRENGTLIYGDLQMPVTVQQKIDELNVTCYQVGNDFAFFDVADMAEQWQYSNASVTLQLPKPSLSLTNTTNAISAVLASPLQVSQEHITQALEQVRLAGRFDYQNIANRHWLFDVAHNGQGMAFLLAQFIPFWQAHVSQYPQAKLHLVFSMLADKPISEVIELLVNSDLPIASWHVAAIDHFRAASQAQLAEKLADELSKQSMDNSQTYHQPYYYDSLAQATKGVIEASASEDMILVCGSFHTIAEVMVSLSESISGL